MTITGRGNIILKFASGKATELTYAEYSELEQFFRQITFVHPWLPAGPVSDPHQPYRLDKDGAYVVVRN